jgi:hypothetical protein
MPSVMPAMASWAEGMSLFIGESSERPGSYGWRAPHEATSVFLVTSAGRHETVRIATRRRQNWKYKNGE